MNTNKKEPLYNYHNMDYKTYYEINDALKNDFGIKYLTSESCAYSMRALYDITNDTGKNIIESFTGMALVNDAWNNGVGSAMILRESIMPLYIYALLYSGYYVIQDIKHERIKYTMHGNLFYNARYEINQLNIKARCYMQPVNPARSGRHVHMFTGRAT